MNASEASTNELVRLFRQQNELLTEIRDLLKGQQVPQAIATPATRYQRHIDEFPDFDWGTIGAVPIELDRRGFVARVRWQDREFSRRCKANDIWFSAKLGTGQDGKPIYERLIEFSPQAKPKSIPEEIREEW